MVGSIFRRLTGEAEKLIALTFDDGPWPQYTEQVLAILQQYAVPATFFWLGESVQKNPQIAQRVAQAGHAIGNHTWRHATRDLSPHEAQAEIERTAQIIEQTTGIQTQMFRPPGGHKENGLNAWATQHGYAVVMWSVQTDDWKADSAEQIVQRVLQEAQPGTVVLLHDGGNNRAKTVAALPQIIEGLQAQGYRLVTVPELMRVETGEKLR
jgi:peptidoglycan/xylan/chitin deacetylase (PgdA/CDA1 family)